MFYTGDLQSGINAAIQQSKVVACFVTDGGDESERWEHEYFNDSRVESALRENAIVLRLEYASQEAAYLAAYQPVEDYPTLIIIRNGELRAHVRAGITKESFIESLVSALQGSDGNVASRVVPTAEADTVPDIPVVTTRQADAVPGIAAPVAPQSLPPVLGQNPYNPEPFSSDITYGSEVAEAESEPTIPEDNPPIPALASVSTSTSALTTASTSASTSASTTFPTSNPPAKEPSTGRQDYLKQQQRRKQKDREDRERVLQRIKDDQNNRRAVDKARREARAPSGKDVEDPLSVQPSPSLSPLEQEVPVAAAASSSGSTSKAQKTKVYTHCNIQVRLFDGSTIRNRFPRHSTLDKDVREWVAQNRVDGDAPYSFKQILTPLPNRTLSISEEAEDLLALGLAPSATLVLVPIKGYTEAYSDASPGLISKSLSVGYGAVGWGVGTVAGVVGSILGVGASTAAAQVDGTSDVSSASAATVSSAEGQRDQGRGAPINIRTLGDQQARDGDRQYYNGNQLNFEPNPDGERKED
ncbi:MAG: hypothetical protein M1825_005309 [Sarcosagium campestre]|nr:MAG: hypothetical protein M1825_005309 [Sarcosagium campestre]